MNMLEKIQSQLKHLGKSECKVVEVIPASPDNAIHSSIAAPALRTNVSEPTVNHFCRSMGTRGLPDLKLRLAQSLANGIPYINRDINEGNSVEPYTGKVFESAMATLDHVRHSLNKSVINRAANLLIQAKKIAFFRLGSSAVVVYDAMNRLFRSNVPVVYSGNIVLQRMDCMNRNDGDVMVLTSRTGRTKNLVELAQLARENDAVVIVLTSAGTPFVREAMLAITLDAPGDTDIYMPMVSRLVQLTVIDMLVTGFTSRRGTKFGDNLKWIKEALKESRFGKQLLNLSDDH